MFGSKKQQKELFPAGGVDNFARCPHKEADYLMSESKGIVYAAKLVCPKVEDSNTAITVRAAELTRTATPTEENINEKGTLGKRNGGGYYPTEYISEEWAFRHLATRASKMICATCVYSDKSKTEVAQIRLGIAEETAAVAKLELQRLQLLSEAKDTQAEINELATVTELRLVDPPELPPSS